MLMTCIQVMMVDYPKIFPRQHCKAEDAGYSTMDVGVSAIMFASGFCSSLIISHKAPSKPRPNLLVRLYKAIFGNIVVLIGAAIRFFMLHGIDYHEHVTEWGTHWNFFVTIACMNVLMCFIPSGRVALPLGIIILMINEFVQNIYDI